MCARGNRVVLDDDGSFALNKKTGEVTPVRKKGNTYVMRVKILRPSVVKQPPAKHLAAVEDAQDSAMEFRRRAQP